MPTMIIIIIIIANIAIVHIQTSNHIINILIHLISMKLKHTFIHLPDITTFTQGNKIFLQFR